MSNASTIERGLWPEISRTPEMNAPVAILRQQASLLGQLTQNVVEGEVETETKGPRFVHTLRLRAPSLDNYNFDLLSVVHLAYLLYPVGVINYVDDDTQGYLQDSLHTREYKDEAEFRERLKGILASDKVKRVIESLILQSTT